MKERGISKFIFMPCARLTRHRDGMTGRGSAPAAAGRNSFPAGRPAWYHNGSDFVAIQVSSNQLRLDHYCDLTQRTRSWMQRRATAIRRHGPGVQGPGTRPGGIRHPGHQSIMGQIQARFQNPNRSESDKSNRISPISLRFDCTMVGIRKTAGGTAGRIAESVHRSPR